MKRFDLSCFPFVGIGIEYVKYGKNLLNPDQKGKDFFNSLKSGRLDYLDYIECQPTHFTLIPEFYNISKKIPVLLHVSQLSLGSINIALDQNILRLTKNIADHIQTPWFAEHISWTRFDGGDTYHFFLPFLDDEVAETVIKNAQYTQKYIGIPLLLENAPRTFSVDVGGPSEKEFIEKIVENSNTGFLLDLESALKTADSLKYDKWEYILSLPLERLVEIHVGNVNNQWEIIEYILKHYSVRAVTLDHNFVYMPRNQQLQITEQIRQYMKGIPRRSVSIN
jgi:uncharacterized protein (UPF0276 family)